MIGLKKIQKICGLSQPTGPFGAISKRCYLSDAQKAAYAAKMRKKGEEKAAKLEAKARAFSEYVPKVFPKIRIIPFMDPKEMRQIIESNMPGVSVANDKESAMRIIDLLYKNKHFYHAADTETIDIDVKKQSPVGHGRVICASLYAGPEVDFGNGPRIYIDNLDSCEGTLDYFKGYFEDEEVMKVWHNYSFDRHVLFNHQINVKGFGGDTMIMARLQDSARMPGTYSLAALSKDHKLGAPKKKMDDIFGKHKKKIDGTDAKGKKTLPPLDGLQRDPVNVLQWIEYSTLDAEVTWQLREVLHRELEKMEWEPGVSTMWDFYIQMWLPFGELLTDIEREGIKLDIDHFNTILPMAEKERDASEAKFLEWAESIRPGCKYMNVSSGTQKRQLFFAPTVNKYDRKIAPLPATKAFKIETVKYRSINNSWNEDEDEEEEETEVFGVSASKGEEMKELVGENENGKEKKEKKNTEFEITGIGLEPKEYTKTGWASTAQTVIDKLAKEGKYLFDKKGINGEDASKALLSLAKTNTIDTLITGFISPLPLMVDPNHRIHCSLNINTETGRLSARKPNLQNQPAMEKDMFGIRKGFVCEPGNSLIVADYGQLELRLLAHITGCKSMIEAFKSGGDFHSRTAAGMYPEIQKALKDGKVLLEWGGEKGKAPAPLLKDVYGNERKRAKELNFSIAYGKTVWGFAKDWGVTKEEAQVSIDGWYADRPEVLLWQERIIRYAEATGYTRTLLGRYRPVPDINSDEEYVKKAVERVCINTPLQGGAADVMVASMLKLRANEKLKAMGWRQLLQIHDELIFEGPEQHAQEALKEIIYDMEHPLDFPLLIDFVVDAKIGKNWFEAK
jgi:DNA polymerase-1